MKLYNFLYISVLVLLASSCKDSSKKDSAAETKIDNAAQPVASSSLDPAKGIIKFKVNGQQISTSAWNASMGNSMTGLCIMNITSNMHEDKRTVAFNLSGYQPGTYQISDKHSANSAYGDYKPDYSDLLNSYQFVDGSVNIISIDTVKGLLNASFSGKVRKSSEEIQITNGKIINGKIRSGITTY